MSKALKKLDADKILKRARIKLKKSTNVHQKALKAHLSLQAAQQHSPAAPIAQAAEHGNEDPPAPNNNKNRRPELR